MKIISEINVSYSSNLKSKEKVNSSKKAFEVLFHSWNKETIELQEEFKVLMLNRGHFALGIYPLSKGGVSETVVDLKLIFSVALKCNASAIIVSHNHPSGNIIPSKADKTLTNRIKKTGEVLGIVLLDHIIVSKDSYFSFGDEGLL